MDDPDGVYQMQCNATVTIGDLETQNFFVEVSDGNTYTGQSAWAVQVTSRTSLANPLRIVGLWEVEGNDWNQANTRVLVRISNHLDYAASIAN